MYRDKELRKYQFYAQPEWPGLKKWLKAFFPNKDIHSLLLILGGIYVSPTLAGSRAGSLIGKYYTKY